jgi:hypothetical protein
MKHVEQSRPEPAGREPPDRARCAAFERVDTALLTAIVHPEVIEHGDVTDLIVPVDDDRMPIVDPICTERDVKGQARRNS